jgi:uncharacterized membrane protein
MKIVTKTFITGVVTVLPMAGTAYLLFWLFSSAESVVGALIRLFLTEEFYRPGMGVAAGLLVIFLIGILMQTWFVQKMVDWGEQILYRVPFIKWVYGSIRDLLHFFTTPPEKRGKYRQMVMAGLGNTGAEVLGFVTRDNFDDLPAGIGNADSVAVYIPMSYQIGGYMLIMPRKAIRPINLSIEEGMRFVITGGLTMKPTSSRPGQGEAKKTSLRRGGRGNEDATSGAGSQCVAP